jgi:HTH-type transcriptional regulator/antitoxin HipB
MQTDPRTTSLGAAIRARRRQLQLTQDEVAAVVGVDRRVVSQLERGKSTVYLTIALRVAEALGLDIRLEPRS